jgi:hypothetical protein
MRLISLTKSTNSKEWSKIVLVRLMQWNEAHCLLVGTVGVVGTGTVQWALGI